MESVFLISLRDRLHRTSLSPKRQIILLKKCIPAWWNHPQITEIVFPTQPHYLASRGRCPSLELPQPQLKATERQRKKTATAGRLEQVARRSRRSQLWGGNEDDPGAGDQSLEETGITRSQQAAVSREATELAARPFQQNTGATPRRLLRRCQEA